MPTFITRTRIYRYCRCCPYTYISADITGGVLIILNAQALLCGYSMSHVLLTLQEGWVRNKLTRH